MSYDEAFFKRFDLQRKWDFPDLLRKNANDNGYDYISEAIYKMYASGLGCVRIGRMIGLTDGGVWKVLKAMNVKMRPTGRHARRGGNFCNFSGVFRIVPANLEKRIAFACGKIDTEKNLYSWLRCSRCHKQLIADEKVTYEEVIKLIKNHICTIAKHPYLLHS